MQLEHSFTVPVGVEEAWRVLLDVERIAPCMPGATLTGIDGDSFTGTVKVKVGPITVTYGGQARFMDKDTDAHTVTIEAKGKETRGSGTASATVKAELKEDGAGSTTVGVVTDLAITGKPAQFGRGVLVDVGGKIIGQFADCLAREISSPAAPAEEPEATGAASPASEADTLIESAAPAPAGTDTAAGAKAEGAKPSGPKAAGVAEKAPRKEAEPIDLLGTAGMPVAKRVAPVLGAVLALVLAVLLVRRRRSG